MRLKVNGVEEDVAVTTVSELLASRGIAEFLISTEKHAQFRTLSVTGKLPEKREAE